MDQNTREQARLLADVAPLAPAAVKLLPAGAKALGKLLDDAAALRMPAGGPAPGGGGGFPARTDVRAGSGVDGLGGAGGGGGRGRAAGPTPVGQLTSADAARAAYKQLKAKQLRIWGEAQKMLAEARNLKREARETLKRECAEINTSNMASAMRDLKLFRAHQKFAENFDKANAVKRAGWEHIKQADGIGEALLELRGQFDNLWE